MDTGSEFPARLGQFPGVVAVRASHHHHDIRHAREVLSGVLSLLGGQTDGVGEAHFGGREPQLDPVDEGSDTLDGLRGLGGDPEPFPRRQGVDVGFGKHDIVGFEVVGDAPDFDMIAAADDDGVKPLGDEGAHGAVGDVDEGAGGFDEAMAAGGDGGEAFFRSAVGRDQDGGSVDGVEILLEADAAAAEVVEHGFVVDEVPEDGDRVGGGFAMSEGQGIADPEAHAHVIGAKNTKSGVCIHALWRKVSGDNGG